MRVVLATWLAVLLVACAAVAGAARADNGVGSMTPAQILAKVKQDVATAKTVHVHGSGNSGGSPLSLDFKLQKGVGGSGPFSSEGIKFDIIRVGKFAYFKGDLAFWSHFTKSKDLATLFVGKWIKVSATSGDFASLTQLTDISALTNGIISGHGALTTGGTTTIEGHKAVGVVEKSSGDTIYVATDGPAYILEIKSGGKGGDKGEILFSDWNKPVAIKAPAKSLDFRKLTG
jgi:hypothetical protein